MQAKIKVVLIKSHRQYWSYEIKWFGLNSIPNFIQIKRELCETTGADVFLSHNPATLNVRQGHFDKYQNVESISIYHHTNFAQNPFISECMPMLNWFPLIPQTLQKSCVRMLLELLHHHINFHPVQLNSVWVNESNWFWYHTDLVTPS